MGEAETDTYIKCRNCAGAGDEIKHPETMDHNRDDQQDGREEKMEDL